MFANNYITIDVYVSDSFHGTDEEWANYRKRLAEIALIEAGLARETLSGLLWL